MADNLRVEGIREFISGLRALDRSLPRELTRFHKDFARTLVPRVQAEYRAHYPKAGSRRRRSKNTVAQIRAVANQRSGGIRIGGARYKFMPGQEFGSDRVRQFAPRAPGGRFLYPTIRAAMPDLRRRYVGEVLNPVLDRAFARGRRR